MAAEELVAQAHAKAVSAEATVKEAQDLNATVQELHEQIDNLQLQAQTATARVASEELLAWTGEDALTQEKHRALELEKELQTSQAELYKIRAVVEELEAAACEKARLLAEARDAVGKAEQKLRATQERLGDVERQQGVHLLTRCRVGIHTVGK
jgi:chromosome segregation ATPase